MKSIAYSHFLNEAVIDPDSMMPKYRQVIMIVLNAIKEGVLKEYDQLPSIDEWCRSLKVSRLTVERGLRHLKKMGIVRFEKGKGHYVFQGEESVYIIVYFTSPAK